MPHAAVCFAPERWRGQWGRFANTEVAVSVDAERAQDVLRRNALPRRRIGEALGVVADAPHRGWLKMIRLARGSGRCVENEPNQTVAMTNQKIWRPQKSRDRPEAVSDKQRLGCQAAKAACPLLALR